MPKLRNSYNDRDLDGSPRPMPSLERDAARQAGSSTATDHDQGINNLKYENLSTLFSAVGFLKVLSDAIEDHKAFWDVGILHGEVDIDNIYYHCKRTGSSDSGDYQGYLFGWDIGSTGPPPPPKVNECLPRVDFAITLSESCYRSYRKEDTYHRFATNKRILAGQVYTPCYLDDLESFVWIFIGAINCRLPDKGDKEGIPAQEVFQSANRREVARFKRQLLLNAEHVVVPLEDLNLPSQFVFLKFMLLSFVTFASQEKKTLYPKQVTPAMLKSRADYHYDLVRNLIKITMIAIEEGQGLVPDYEDLSDLDTVFRKIPLDNAPLPLAPAPSLVSEVRARTDRKRKTSYDDVDADVDDEDPSVHLFKRLRAGFAQAHGNAQDSSANLQS
ncbi:hypothetical protein CVT24_001544 [Panaeolus cyanescens]|uniref:Fungal-type protein kinase domain-containing protein n=1 Tax=Panaeolus cyanescens TaxID=181874 RepID=A0A409W2W6_9AGAR|nr:hypothetical protein CVT24_001544 [Panaeolus cyanescens]